MQKVNLKIETPFNSQTVTLEDELSIGRTNQANVAVDDVGLSRVNTTFFRDGDKIFVVDENSLNGTFLNGEKIIEPTRILDGDLIKIGSETQIFIKIDEGKPAAVSSWQPETSNEVQKPKTENETKSPKSKIQNPKSDKPPFVLIAAAVATFSIIFVALIVILIVKRYENSNGGGNTKPTPRISKDETIPVRVIEPFGNLEPKELQELSQYWEVPEKEIEVSDLQDINISAPADSKSPGTDSLVNLKVSVEFWRQQRDKALAGRNAPTGNDPPGLRNDLTELCCGVPKQTAKLAFMLTRTPPYRQPMDFADLADKKMRGELLELPMATEDYVLEVGGSSNSEEFTGFDFKTGSVKIAPGTPDYMILAQLASNFSGEKYDLSNPDHRRQMKIRLLRMFHPRAFPLLNDLAKAYRQKFNRPLRVTSLTRSMEYQISLNKTNPNSFKVRGAGSLPPHTSGCAFDLARKQMTAEEQNFMMEELAKLERAGKLDALREGNLNACFHVFIYDDGVAPKM
jgi:pSer/pThr/pTyr-binding forkhead associated (FHA) protein